MSGLGDDFLAECTALDALVDTLGDNDLSLKTDFHGWTVRDEIMHLLFLDELTLRAIEQESAFLAQLAEIRQYQAHVGELSQYMRERYADLDRAALLASWRETYAALAARFAAGDRKARMKWFGPDMSLVSAASARQMEVWAHGQDIYDRFGIERQTFDRVRNICELGVRTYAWSFRNRGLDLPAPPPRVELAAPSGTIWVWHAEETSGCLRGPARDFALLVTQRRHVRDTALVAEGAGASNWMEIAQCFAGAASDGPPARSETGAALASARS